MYRNSFAFALLLAAGCGSVTLTEEPDAGPQAGDAHPEPEDEADAAPAAACTPSTTTCEGGPGANDWELVTCDDNGHEAARVPCQVGCDASGCLDIDPSNGLAAYMAMTETGPDVVVVENATITIDTDAMTWTGFGVTTPPAHALPGIAVFMVHSLRVEGDTSSTEVNVTGSRALAILAHDDIVIGGLFSARAHGNQPGPGAPWTGDTCRGKPGDNERAPRSSGGGGGSFGSAGGGGGKISDTGAPTIWGGFGGESLVPPYPALEPLAAGCPGAHRANAQIAGGGGGGAIQLVSRKAIHLAGGWINVDGGGGGRTEHNLAVNIYATAPGGGSGGAVLLEAPKVKIGSGGITAHGGGGGCLQYNAGSGYIVHGGKDGAEGGAGASCIQEGGTLAQGGPGATQYTSNLDGEHMSWGTSNKAGGGGGGLGRIHIDSWDPEIENVFPEATVKPLRTRPQE